MKNIAIFIGMQFGPDGLTFPQFNIIDKGGAVVGTVGMATLRKRRIRISWTRPALDKLEADLKKMEKAGLASGAA